MSSHHHQQPFALPGHPGLTAFPGVGGSDDKGKDAALRQAMAMGPYGHPPPPSTPGKRGKGGRGGGKKAPGEEEESEYEEEDEDEEDDDDSSDANNQEGGEFVMGPNGMRRRRKRLTKKWTAEEDMILAQLVTLHGQRDWGLIARHMPGRFRKGKQCRERWRNQVCTVPCGWIDEWMDGWTCVHGAEP